MEVTFFERPGRENTEEAIALAVERAKELGIKTLVVASNSGDTAELCLGRGLGVVCVTHHVGYVGPGIDEMGAEVRADLAVKGVKVLTSTHLFAGVDRALRIQAGGLYPGEIVGHTLRMFGQGIKVGVECAVMALDAGLIEYGKPVVALGGTGRGADTAMVLTPEHSNQFFKTKIQEIICKPR